MCFSYNTIKTSSLKLLIHLRYSTFYEPNYGSKLNHRHGRLLGFTVLEAPTPYRSRQGGHVIIFMPILLLGVPRLHTQKWLRSVQPFLWYLGTDRRTDGEL